MPLFFLEMSAAVNGIFQKIAQKHTEVNILNGTALLKPDAQLDGDAGSLADGGIMVQYGVDRRRTAVKKGRTRDTGDILLEI